MNQERKIIMQARKLQLEREGHDAFRNSPAAILEESGEQKQEEEEKEEEEYMSLVLR